jgi:L-rhamnose mutarotase
MIIGLREEKLDVYRTLHTAVWPEVLRTIEACNIRNFSIYLRKLDDGEHYLFGYFEYIGANLEADQARMAADPATRRWWTLTEPCQKPVGNRDPGEWWANLEEVFHCD